MVEPNAWLRCAQKVSELGLAGAGGPSADLLVDALRILLWLCAERAPVPHSVELGPKKSVVFGWHQGDAVVELRAITPGCSEWRTSHGKDDLFQSDRLDAKAAQVLCTLIPLANHLDESDADGARVQSRAQRNGRRGRPSRRAN
jgi:hypothetical protein